MRLKLLILLILPLYLFGQTKQDSVAVQPLSAVPSIPVNPSSVFLMQTVVDGKSVWTKFTTEDLYDYFQKVKLPKLSPSDGSVLIYRSGNDSLSYEELLIDKTRLIQDSILVFYQNDTEIGRDTLRVLSEVNPGFTYFDTTFTSNGNDFVSSSLATLLDSYDEVRIDAILQAGPSSNLQVSLPSASSYPGRKVIISAINQSTTNSILVFGAGNQSPSFSMTTGQAVVLFSMRYGDSFAWVLVGGAATQNALSGVNVTSDGIDTINLSEAKIIKLDVSNVSLDSIILESPIDWQDYTFDLTGVSIDTIVFSDTLFTPNSYLTGFISTNNLMFSMYYDGSQYRTPNLIGIPYPPSSSQPSVPSAAGEDSLIANISGLQGWWRPDSVTLTGSSVIQAFDKSGNERHLSQFNASGYPVSNTLVEQNVLNGQAAFGFGGQDNLLMNSDFLYTNQMTAVVVFKDTSFIDGARADNISSLIIYDRDANSITGDNRNFQFRTNNSADNLEFLAFASSPSVNTISTGFNSEDATWAILEINATGGNIGLNGLNNVAAASFTPKNIGSSDFSLGAALRNSSNIFPLSGYIFDVFIFNKVLSAQERADIGTYISTRYGL